jgi:hypothetical protein
MTKMNRLARALLLCKVLQKQFNLVEFIRRNMGHSMISLNIQFNRTEFIPKGS